MPRPPSQPRPATPPLVLVGLSGVVEGVRWQLNDPVTIIGRDAERQIALPDPLVSHSHAQIIRQPAGYYISDLDSSNGTLLNGKPLIAPTLLSPGDMLEIGAVALRCEVVTTSVPPTVPLDDHLRALAETMNDAEHASEYTGSVEAFAPSAPLPHTQLSATEEPLRSPTPRLMPQRLRPSDPPC